LAAISPGLTNLQEVIVQNEKLFGFWVWQGAITDALESETATAGGAGAIRRALDEVRQNGGRDNRSAPAANQPPTA
jgi:hypothetical protein